jgi:hypothetical protein
MVGLKMLGFRRAKTKQGGPHSPLDDSNRCDTPTTAVLKLHSKIKTAWKVLDTINFSLYHETTNEILLHKPIFDEQKQKLILLESVIEKIYQCGLIVAFKPFSSSISFSSAMLNSKTKYSDWNEVANQINFLLSHVVEMLSTERDLENGMEWMRSQGGNNLPSDDESKRKRSSSNWCPSCVLYLFLFFLVIIFLLIVLSLLNLEEEGGAKLLQKDYS